MNFIEYELRFIEFLQLLDYEYAKYIIQLSKFLTKRKIHYIYLCIFLYYGLFYFLHTLTIYYLSRFFVLAIKSYIKQYRPYYDYPDRIKYYKKMKDSYCFPSQSIVNLCIIYFCFNELCHSIYLDYYFYFLVLLQTFTRSYRGLHYLHDIFYSFLLSIILYLFFKVIEINIVNEQATTFIRSIGW